MTRRALAVGLVLLFAGSGATRALETIRFHSTNMLASAVLHVGIALGFFEAEGLDVEVMLFNHTSAAVPAMAQGKIDAAESSPFSARYVNIIHRGGRLRLVAARTVHAAGGCGYASFLARAELLDSGRLRGPEDLRGLRISTERTDSTFYYWSRLLERGGLTLDDVVVKEVPKEAKPDAFAMGLLDVASATEPWVTRIADHGDARVWLPVNDVLPDRQNTFLILGRRLLDERRDLGERVVRAYLRAMRQLAVEGKSDRMVRIIADYTRMDPDELRRMCWPQFSTDGRIDPRGLLEYQEWALAEGLIDAVVPPERLIDDGFLPAAQPLPGGAGDR